MSGLRTYGLRVTWEIASMALRFLVPLQVAFAAMLAIGLGMLVPDLTPEAARFLTTGAPTTMLLTIGIVVIPQEIARRRDTGVHDFMRTIPGSQIAHLGGLLTPHLVINIPGSLLSVVVAAWYYDFSLDPSLLVLPALMVVSVTGASIGNAIAIASPSTVVTSAVSQMALFFLMLFSPINYPADRLPLWLQHVHEVLPFEAMATVVRSSFIGDAVPVGDMIQVATWALASFALSATFASRRS